MKTQMVTKFLRVAALGAGLLGMNTLVGCGGEGEDPGDTVTPSVGSHFNETFSQELAFIQGFVFGMSADSYVTSIHRCTGIESVASGEKVTCDVPFVTEYAGSQNDLDGNPMADGDTFCTTRFWYIFSDVAGFDRENERQSVEKGIVEGQNNCPFNDIPTSEDWVIARGSTVQADLEAATALGRSDWSFLDSIGWNRNGGDANMDTPNAWFEGGSPVYFGMFACDNPDTICANAPMGRACLDPTSCGPTS